MNDVEHQPQNLVASLAAGSVTRKNTPVQQTSQEKSSY
jgi:hypothetical protein